ncbi:baseplate J/gp47 family protein [Cupriavidus basilensis]|uniref:baseplate J/gp47 family protein n=1 Tax=Cupriavidus basilensis TaxID=68895 RepID=UPI00240F861E|nr:baseplate J/gp47 family protein [Cupriavidus basilensis]
MSRLPATYATWLVTFPGLTATQQVAVPVGATIQTADGRQQYAVVAARQIWPAAPRCAAMRWWRASLV